MPTSPAAPPEMSPEQLTRWRRRRFRADSAVKGRQRAARWYGVKLRAWEQYEYGERPIPLPLIRRIRAEARLRRRLRHALAA